MLHQDVRPGDRVRVSIHGVEQVVKVIACHGLGTLDVQTADGSCYRCSGLETVARAAPAQS